jgi:hypothetical protein
MTMLRPLHAFFALAVLLATPAAAGATTILANGGSYFAPSGPSWNWWFDWGEGYCGKYGPWCRPNNFQWTFTTSTFGGENKARWTNPYPTDYPSKVFAFIPRRNATSKAAPYKIVYQGVSRSTSYVNQMAYYDAWAPLGWGESFRTVTAIDLTDSTFETPRAKIAFDEIKIEN